MWPLPQLSRLLAVCQQCLTCCEGGQVLDKCVLAQIRDAEPSWQAIGKHAFITEKSTIPLQIRMKLISLGISKHMTTCFRMFTLAHRNHLTFETQLFQIPKELIYNLHKFEFWKCFGFHKLPPSQSNNLYSHISFLQAPERQNIFLTTNDYLMNIAFNGHLDLPILHSFRFIALSASKQNLVGIITSRKYLYL